MRGLTQTVLAERAGITKSMLCLYENGKQLPSLQTLGRILDALDSDLVELQAALVASRDGCAQAFPWSRPAEDSPRGSGPEAWSALADIMDGYGMLAHGFADQFRALAAARPDAASAER